MTDSMLYVLESRMGAMPKLLVYTLKEERATGFIVGIRCRDKFLRKKVTGRVYFTERNKLIDHLVAEARRLRDVAVRAHYRMNIIMELPNDELIGFVSDVDQYVDSVEQQANVRQHVDSVEQQASAKKKNP
jgi:hypothetical protein